MSEQVVQADLTWLDGAFRPNVEVCIAADGRIAAVGAAERYPTQPLRRRALLPGFVSAHSHAFQRGLRGRGETFPAGAGSFWSWREAMYELVGRLDVDAFRALTLQAFREMRAAGITAVGEFHYLHHTAADVEDYAFDELVLEAAREAGIRLVLLETYYRTGGIGRPLAGAQQRFGTPSPERFWRQLDKLVGMADPTTQTVGVALHSVRAVPREELSGLYAEARRRGLPVHMHLEEQRQEIEECREAYGRSPFDLLRETIDLAEGFTAVHCTHTSPADLASLLAAGGNVCLCPLTEANLGDGLPVLPETPPPAQLCLGTDSNVRISMFEVMRWLEYGQRLRREGRGALRDERGAVAPVLLDAATRGGARALGLPTGAIAPGLWADFVAIDLDTPALAGWEPETLLESLVFGAGEEAIAATCVGGRWQERPVAR
ncbi:MAG TPA: formimidoylglutamate deiminase [Thermoanaerobaculia bacterium]|nr:formimidoylglutamate deiminase [Thermoanaerobaculia bacterium]